MPTARTSGPPAARETQVRLAEPRPIDLKLTEAVSGGNVARVRELLAKGANANVGYDNDRNLLTALSGVDRQAAIAIAELLVAHGANVNYRRGSEGFTPLTYTVVGVRDPLPMVHFLLSKGAKVDVPINDGTTALRLAINCGYPNVVKELLAHGASLNSRTDDAFQVAERQALEKDRQELEKRGLTGYQYPTPEVDTAFEPGYRYAGRTPVFGLAQLWNPEIFAILQTAKADFRATDVNGWTVLHYAAKNGNLPAVEALLKLGLDPNAASKQGFRPAHAAVRPASPQSPIETLTRLRDAGADFQAKNAQGQTPLDLLRADVATQFNDRRILSLPLERRQAYLAYVTEIAQILDPKAPPITAPTPVVDAEGTRHPDLDLAGFRVKRATRKEGDRMILSLTFADPPPVLTKLTLRDIQLGNYETSTPLPHIIELRPGRPTTARFEFPAAVGSDVAVNAKWVYTQSNGPSGEGTQNETLPPNPTFRLSKPLEVSHDIPGRVLIFQLVKVTRKGKPVKTFPKGEFKIEPGRFRAIPGLQSPHDGTLNLTYRMRLLPNKRWVTGGMRF